MKTHVSYIYERKIMNAKTRFHTNRFDPSMKLLEIVVVVLDDDDKVIERHYYKVTEEE